MKADNVNDFKHEKECTYQGERYSVRDNGAIFRYQRNGKRKRPYDNQWTFGKGNTSNPYLHISNVRVHRIVATAFHGEPPDSKYVVDHIDSNCRNNRPENLRWLTRLENALKNPATRKKIEYLCGSIEAFLDNPSMLNELQGDRKYEWMRTVTVEEAQNCKRRMELWARTNNVPKNSNYTENCKYSFNKRALKPLQKWEAGLGREPGLDFALTPWCAQYMWGADAYFPCCPQEFGNDPLDDYFQNLKVSAVFAYNDDAFPKLTVFKPVIHKNKSSILVMCKRHDGYWSIVGIMLNEKLHFIHFYLGSYLSKKEANNAFSIKKDLDDFWSSGYNNPWDIS